MRIAWRYWIVYSEIGECEEVALDADDIEQDSWFGDKLGAAFWGWRSEGDGRELEEKGERKRERVDEDSFHEEEVDGVIGRDLWQPSQYIRCAVILFE